MSKYAKISEARKLLGLPEAASLTEVKAAYRNLAKKYHPDTCKDTNAEIKEKIRQIIAAYHTLLSYCEEYRISFARKEVNQYLTGKDWWVEHFGDDPLWGNPKTKK